MIHTAEQSPATTSPPAKEGTTPEGKPRSDTPARHRIAPRKGAWRRRVARELAYGLIDPDPYGRHWHNAALDIDAAFPPVQTMLAQAQQVIADAARTPGKSWIGYTRAHGDSVVLIHGPQWSLVFAAHGRHGIDGTIYLVSDDIDDAFPLRVEHDSRRIVEFSYLLHLAFGPPARCWD